MVMKKVAKAGGSGKNKKKKWSKGKVRDKLENAAFLDQATYDKAAKEIAKMTLVTPAIVSEKFKLKVSVARRLMLDLVANNIISQVNKSHTTLICTKKAAPVVAQ